MCTCMHVCIFFAARTSASNIFLSFPSTAFAFYWYSINSRGQSWLSLIDTLGHILNVLIYLYCNYIFKSFHLNHFFKWTLTLKACYYNGSWMTFTYRPLVLATYNLKRVRLVVYLASRWRTQNLPAFTARHYSSTLTRIIKYTQKVVNKKLGVDSSIWGELFWLCLTKDPLGRARNDAWTTFILVLFFIALGGFIIVH